MASAPQGSAPLSCPGAGRSVVAIADTPRCRTCKCSRARRRSRSVTFRTSLRRNQIAVAFASPVSGAGLRELDPAVPVELPGSPGSSPFRTALPVRSAVPALTRAVVGRGRDRASRGGRRQQPCAGYGCGSKKGTLHVLKSKVFAAAATLTLVGGVSTVGVLSACCCHPVVRPYLHRHLQPRSSARTSTPNFVLDVWRQGAKVGQPIILFRTSNTDPAEDFNASLPGPDLRLLRGRPGVRRRGPALRLRGLGTDTAPTASRTTRRSSSSTRRSAWTAACAWASPAPPSRARSVSLQPCGVSSQDRLDRGHERLADHAQRTATCR